MNIEQIGYVNTNVKLQRDKNWGKTKSEIIINENLAQGLTGISSFSHIIVVYHLNEAKFIKEEVIVPDWVNILMKDYF